VTGRAGGSQGFGPLAAIRRQYPDWRPWRSDAGRFWATRAGTLPRRIPPGYAMTLDGDTPAQLAEAIRAQEAKVPGG
jgi:hypothetical protein